MSKIAKCNEFIKKLEDFRLNFHVFNKGYQIQIQIIHNFYPSTGSYYNSETGEKLFYPDFKDRNDLLKWIAKRTK